MHTPYGGLMWSCCGLPGYQMRKGAKPSAAALASTISLHTHSSTSSRRDDMGNWGCKLAKRHVTQAMRRLPDFLQQIKDAKELGRSAKNGERSFKQYYEDVWAGKVKMERQVW